MIKYECYECKHMKSLEDEYGRMFYFCMYSQSPCFLEETGDCGWCELDGMAEECYQELEKNDHLI